MDANIEPRQYLVIQDHTSEYPEPITFEKGAPLTVGEKYEGPEDWDNWFFCETPGQKGGWVPAQIIETLKDKTARASQSYTAKELNVRQGDLLVGSKILNGWVWCNRSGRSESGWVPLACLQESGQ
ncbi:SH3 domain-containing protein [Desulfonatronovibrio hydrogenovorans]|uniref:SH3 domain-containing protein n=1 Tax=Desulfonatronovibrio hydrogenovorans TaxID=53245 RepID=UPI0004915079|nr:SH3 domain-containing protein [Desulfonatronovibrio hydrogenovorans]